MKTLAGLDLGRRLFHVVAGSVFPLAALLAPLGWVQGAAVTVAAVFVLGEALRFMAPPVNRGVRRVLGPVLKAEEELERPTGATYMLLATVLCLFLFERGIAVAALLFLALGDPAAAVAGTRLGRWHMWGKSVEGTLAFGVVATGVGLGLYAASYLPNPWVAIAGALVAALAELMPLPGDDNLWVPLSSGVAMALLLP